MVPLEQAYAPFIMKKPLLSWCLLEKEFSKIFENGDLVGHNTDIVGFDTAIKKLDFSIKDKKV